MVTCPGIAGYEARLYIGGSIVAYANDLGLEATKEHARFYQYGTIDPLCLFQGKNRMGGNFRRLFVDCAYWEHLMGTAEVIGSFCPEGIATGATGFAGTVVLTGWSLAAPHGPDPVLENIDFEMVNITCGTIVC